MRSASVADWILRLFVGKERAAAIVGDLVEISQRKGMLWFWFSVIGVVAARTWRSALGISLITYSGLWFSVQLNKGLTSSPGHYIPDLWMFVFKFIFPIASALSFATVYSAIRFDVRDRFVRSSFAVAAVCLGLFYGWWQPIALGGCIVGFAGIVILSAARRDYRRTVLALSAVVGTGYLSVYLIDFLSWMHNRLDTVLLGPYKTMTQSEFHERPHMLWMGALGWHGIPINGRPSEFWIGFWGSEIIEALAIAAACEVMRRWAMSKPQTNQALEDGETLPGIS